MRERRDRSAAAIRLQSGDGRALQQKWQQFRLVEDLGNELAVVQVVARERGFVFAKPPLDLVHARIRAVDRLAFAQQRPRDVFQTERRKIPRRRAQRLDAVDHEPSRDRNEPVIAVHAVLAPFGRAAVAAERERHAVVVGVSLENAQVELHDIPADDRVRIVSRDPRDEPAQHVGAGIAIVEGEIGIGVIGTARSVGRRPEHVHLTRAAAFERDRIKLALHARFDIERHDSQRRTVIRRGLQLARNVTVARHALERRRRRDESLHQIALVRTDIGFEDLNARASQVLFEREQLAILRAIEPEHRLLAKVLERQLAHIRVPHAGDDRFRLRAIVRANERDARLRRDEDFSRAVIGCEPEIDFRPGRGVAPVTSQQKTLLCRSQADIFECACHRSILLGGKNKARHAIRRRASKFGTTGKKVKRGSGRPVTHHPRGRSPEEGRRPLPPKLPVRPGSPVAAVTPLRYRVPCAPHAPALRSSTSPPPERLL
ncbi:hypothetical protein AWB82_07155 [Caballeronia glebae]|uniref:Uncharacterized protein n=1 Tax=Caballeronia glebae TaxID=1777143 RepID=A0A158DT08_9BURK|nr:hypothetical protein AWB82_07155 [Caballeronia glebae]